MICILILNCQMKKLEYFKYAYKNIFHLNTQLMIMIIIIIIISRYCQISIIK